MRPSTVERFTIFVCWGLTVALWTLAGTIAVNLIGDRVPAAYNLLLTAAAASTGASVYLTATYRGRRAIVRRLAVLAAEVEATREQLRGKDEAWAAVNRALSAPTGERPHLRLAAHSTDAH